MKDYGRDGRLKPEKKKKRKFEVIIDTATHGIYSDITPMKVAKKVTSELVGKKKNIIFHLREKGKSGKKYGPYIGYIKDEKAIVRIKKMSGGVVPFFDFYIDKDWNGYIRTHFIEQCNYTGKENSSNFKFQFKELEIQNSKLNMVIFGTNTLYVDDRNLSSGIPSQRIIPIKYYLPYVYYLFEDKLEKKFEVKFKKIEQQGINLISINDISFDEISQVMVSNGSESVSIIKLLYDSLQKQFSIKNLTDKKKQLITRLGMQIDEQKSIFSNIKSNNKSRFNISKQISDKLLENYRCIDLNKEVNIVKIMDNYNIFFGYDQNLVVNEKDIYSSYNNNNNFGKKQDKRSNSFKFYYKYKYSYSSQKFFILKKDTLENKKILLYDVEIDINLIPIYDILTLYNTLTLPKNNPNLNAILEERINQAKENISIKSDGFSILELSNFNKETRSPKIQGMSLEEKTITSADYKNFGKIKKRRVTEKTYIFFGARTSNNTSRNIESRFLYVCFREGKKAYYYYRPYLKEKPKQLSELGNIDALKDLISFILLRRMASNKDKDFADIILQEAKATLKFWEFQRISEKMIQMNSPDEFMYVSNKNYYGQRKLKEIITLNSILPISSEPIE